MGEAVFTGTQILIMRQAFDALAERGTTRPEHVARMIMRAVQEGASTPSTVVEKVELMLKRKRLT